MKTANLFRPTLLAAGIVFVFACNKSNTGNNGNGTSNNNSALESQADDQAQVSVEDEAITNDASVALYNQPITAGTSSNALSSSGTTIMGNEQTTVNGVGVPVRGLICDASVVVDTSNGLRTITITYDGTNCWGNRTRQGVVVISIPVGVYWRDPGATVTLSIQNLKITRIRDGKTIVLNGTKNITNVSGGLLVDLATLGSITHTISGSLSITFANGSERVWNVAKQRVFSYNNGIVITTTGTHTDSLNNSDVAEWGTNRFGTEFESRISQPKVIRQDCDFRLVSGQNIILRSDNITSTITYGLDENGNPTGCPGSGTYYLKAVVVFPNGNVYTRIMPY
jgi:hypothetical protein